MKKKVISIFLVFALMFTLIPATAFAAIRTQGSYNGVNYTISDDGVLTISSGEATEEYAAGDMGDFPDSSSYTAWKYNMEDVNKIVIAEGIKRIGAYAFDYAYTVKEIVLPSTLESIGKNAFYGTDITSVDIPASVTTIGESAFNSCNSLTQVTFHEGLTTIGDYAFSSSALQTLALPSSITSVGTQAFHNTPFMTMQEASGVQFVTNNTVLLKGIHHFAYDETCVIPEGITCIADSAFYDVEVYDVELPSTLKYIGNLAFFGGSDRYLKGDKHMTALDLKNVTHIGANAFKWCHFLNRIDLSSVEYLGDYAFEDCRDLKTVVMSDSLRQIGAEVLSKSFHSNYPYDLIVLPETFSNLELISHNAFLGTYIFDDAYAAASDGFCYLGDILLSVTAPGENTFGGEIAIKDGTRIIADNAFEYFSIYINDITTLIIPESVEVIGDISYIGDITDIYYAGDEAGWNSIIKKSATNASYPENYYKNITIHCAKSSAVNLDSCFIDLDFVETEYTGEIFKPALTIKTDDGTMLKEGVDYEATYANNKNAGTGTVTIVGIGNYLGTIEKEFKITKVPKAEITVKMSDDKFTYNAKNQTPVITAVDRFGNKLEEETDYTLSYSKKTRKSPGKYTITVKFKGNYSGNTKLTYYIVPGATSTLKVNLSTKSNGYDDIVVKWDVVSLASGYRVYYKKSTSSKWSYADLKSKSIGNSYTIKNLSDGVKYNVKVVAYYKDPNTGKKYEAEKSKSSTIYTLTKVTGVTVKKSSSSKVKVSWKNISGESGYQISKSTKKTKTNITSTYKTTSGKSKTISAAKKKTYYYKVRAYKTVDGKKVYGPWSAVKSYKLK